MKTFAIKTNIIKPGDSINDSLLSNIENISENDLLVIATKIISISQNRLVKIDEKNIEHKEELIKSEAEYYIDPSECPYNLTITIKNSRLGLKSGIDSTNIPAGYYVLWPENPQESVNQIWEFLRQEYKVKNLGVVIADTTSIPLRKSFVGGCVAYCGFSAMMHKNETDLFGNIKNSNINIAETAAVIGVSEMGETNEQTPLCIIRDLNNIEFKDTFPTQKELDDYYLNIQNDVFSPVFKNAPWKKGGKSRINKDT